MRGGEDRRSHGRVADRVGDDVRERLLHAAPVGDHSQRIRIDIERDPLAALLGEDRVIRDDIAHERDRVDLLPVEGDLAFLEARHLEELGGELLEALHVALRALRELALGLRERPGALSEQQLDRATDDRERAPKVVRHRREEFALDAVGLS